MKKIKISELPIGETLKGLFTIGVDSLNRSVKVSLQFVEDLTQAAVKSADEATSRSKASTEAAQAATADTVKATEGAVQATKEAQKSKAAADTATVSANLAAQNASKKAEAADSSTQRANAATEASIKATEGAVAATAETIQATEAAQAATEETLAKIAVLIPSGLTAECLSRLTWGNVKPVRIKTALSPETAMRNLIFISDNRAVDVSTDGVLTIVSKGVSRVHVIPTQNTALARTLLIEVGDPCLRLSTLSGLRFTQAGGFRLT